MTEFLHVSDEQTLLQVAALADKIWHECFVGIISGAQIDYMVEKFQSFNAMKEQIESGYTYFRIVFDGQTAGYFAVCPQEDALFLSKLYVLAEFRRRGLARQAFTFVMTLAKAQTLPQIRLSVNRGNDRAIAAYQNFGMVLEKTQVQDIGGGFVMDDDVFVYPIK